MKAQEKNESADVLSGEVLAAARKFFHCLAGAIRAFHIYPPAHASSVEAVRRTCAAFQEAAHTMASIAFSVQRDSFTIGEHVMYRGTGEAGCPAAKLYREGIRRIMIDSSAPPEEIIALATILATTIRSDSVDDDLIIQLWEANFSQIAYELVEVPLADYEGEAYEDEEAVAERGSDETHLIEEEPELSARGPRQVEADELTTIKGRLLARFTVMNPVRIDWERELSPEGVLPKLLHALIMDECDPEVLATAAARGVELIISLTEKGRFVQAARMLADLHQAYERANPTHWAKEAIGKQISQLGASTYIDVLKKHVETSARTDLASLQELLRLLPQEGLILFARGVVEMPHPLPLRKIFRDVAKTRPRALYELLSDSNPQILESALEGMGEHADTGIVPYLKLPLRSASNNVRLLALHVLGRFVHIPKAIELMVPLLCDASADIRELCVGLLAGSHSDYALTALRDCVLNKAFQERPRHEKRDFLLTFSSKAKDESIPVLRQILDQRKLLGGKKLREFQTVALEGLDAIESLESESVLRHYCQHGPRWIRKACARLLSTTQQPGYSVFAVASQDVHARSLR